MTASDLTSLGWKLTCGTVEQLEEMPGDICCDKVRGENLWWFGTRCVPFVLAVQGSRRYLVSGHGSCQVCFDRLGMLLAFDEANEMPGGVGP